MPTADLHQPAQQRPALRADLHTLFDLHLIAIDPSFRVIVSSPLDA